MTTYGCNVGYVARSDYADHTFLHQHLDIILNMGHPKRLQNTFPLILGAQRLGGAGSLLTCLFPHVSRKGTMPITLIKKRNLINFVKEKRINIRSEHLLKKISFRNG